MSKQQDRSMSSLDIHYKFAVKIGEKWVAIDKDGNYFLSWGDENAETRWDIRGIVSLQEAYIKAEWNATMGDKPIMEVVRVHRPQRINHAW